jgi:hypothetical protein
MTVADTSRKAGPFDGNGVTTNFPFDFKVFAKTDVRVVRSDLIGVEADLVLDSDYTVNLNADQDATPGGTVGYAGPPILPAGWKLVILGSTPDDQVTDITNVGRFNSDVIERTLDRTTIQIQQLKESITRTVQVPPTSSIDPKDLLQNLTIQANEVFEARDQVVDIAAHFSDEANARLDQIQAEGDAILDGFSVDGANRLNQFSSDAASQLAQNDALAAAQRQNIQLDANAVIAAMGYMPPVTYTAGLAMTSPRQTVTYLGQTYAPNSTDLPFVTSGVFEVAKFRLIQGVTGTDLASVAGLPAYAYSGTEMQNILDNAFAIQDYVGLRAFAGRARSVRITGLYVGTTPSGIAGIFIRVDGDVTSADDGGTIIVDALGRRWKRYFDGYIYAAWFDPNYAGDTWPALQAAINVAAQAGRPQCVFIASRVHNISRNLRLPQYVGLIGDTVSGSIINKTTTTVDDLGLIQAPRVGTVNDNYNVDSVVSIVHPANDFARFNRIENLTLSRDTVGAGSYCIFAPRFAYASMRNLVLSKAGKGIFSYVAFLSRFEDISSQAMGRGFSIENDGTGLGGSTSLLFTRCYANGMNTQVEPDVGFFLYGVSYFNLIGCGIDNHVRTDAVQSRGYWFASCNAGTLIGCGVENIKGEFCRAESSPGITVLGLKVVGVVGAAFAGTVGARYINASTVTFMGCQFGAITSPGTIFNIVLQGGSHLTDINIPVDVSGGSASVSLAGGSTWSALRNGVWTIRDATSTRTAMYSSSAIAGTCIATGGNTGVMGGNIIDSGLTGGLLAPRRVHAWVVPATDAIPTVQAHVTERYSSGGSFKVRFTNLNGGTENSGGSFNIEWAVFAPI